jgi:hypothetical protein
MHWIRSHIRLGSRLALFVLAVQTVLSFGHVHLVVSATGSTNGVLPAIADQSSPALARAVAPIQSDGSSGGDCAICALIQLSSTSAPAAAPSLPLPANLAPLALEAATEWPLAASPYFLFQARAPPSI